MPDPTLREQSAIKTVWMERVEQDAKWGEQNHGNLEWLAILSEEFGEVGECICKGHLNDDPKAAEYLDLLEYELIQVAAVCVAWVECIRRNEELTDA